MDNFFLEPQNAVGFKKIYVFEDSIRSYNPLVITLKQKVPGGFYLYQMLLRKDGSHVYELIPSDNPNASLTDVHYVEIDELQIAFKLGLAVFATKQEET
jgi:hypothetical protein